MAVGAAAARSKANKRKGPPVSSSRDRARVEKNRQRMAEQAKITELFRQKDVDASGGLNPDQMKDFMQDYIKTTTGNADKIVSDAEVKYVMEIADTFGDGEVEEEEMTRAVATWQALLNDQEMIASRFDVYDTDSTGTLDKPQVAEVLKDLNGGEAVPVEEADWVIESADGKGPKQLVDGVLNKEELKVAVAVWYLNVAEKSKQSSACSIL